MSKAVIAPFAVVAVVALISGILGYQSGLEDGRGDWCHSLGGKVSGDLCVKGDTVVLRW